MQQVTITVIVHSVTGVVRLKTLSSSLYPMDSGRMDFHRIPPCCLRNVRNMSKDDMPEYRKK